MNVGVSHTIDWHEVPGDYEPRCVWTDAPLMGARVQVRPDGGDPVTLVEDATDGNFAHYTGTTYYAASYSVTVNDHGTVYNTDSFSLAPLFTVTASASGGILFMNWSPCDSPTATPCVGGVDNPNDLSVELEVTDANGATLFDQFVPDRGAMGYRINSPPDIVTNAARVSLRRGLRVFTDVTR